jgi:hypothetical protein
MYVCMSRLFYNTDTSIYMFNIGEFWPEVDFPDLNFKLKVKLKYIFAFDNVIMYICSAGQPELKWNKLSFQFEIQNRKSTYT